MPADWKPNPKLRRGLLVGLASAAVALAFWGMQWLESWEAKTWDWRVRLMAKPGVAADQIRLILLDQSSLDWGEEQKLAWPWPRQLYSAILNFCRRSGAKAVAFDVIFTEFSAYGVEDDAALGAAINAFGNFAGAIFLGQSSGDQQQWPETLPAPRLTVDGLTPWLQVNRPKDIIFPRASMPIPELVQNAAVLCNVSQSPDSDGIYRRITPLGIFDGYVFPSLGLGAYLAAQRGMALRIEPGEILIGQIAMPIDHQGNVLLRYRGPSGTHKFYTASEILAAEMRLFNSEPSTESDKAILRDLQDKYVFFGFSAPGLRDLRSAPVSGVYSGVEIHATLLDNLLSGDFLKPFPLWLTILLLIGLTGCCAVLAAFFSSPLANTVIGIVFVGLPIIFAIGCYILGFWMPLVVQEMAAATATVLALVINYQTEGRQKRFIKDAFKHYLSPTVIEQLIQNPAQLKLGGERRVISIFFSDLQGFTSISEKLEPEELTTLLNDYLSAMTEIIQEEGGTVDKYEGDAIIAFWNAPLSVPDHAVRVVRAAIHCQEKLAELRPVFHKRVDRDLFMRIGINTGAAVVGNMGSHSRFDYTMLGDSVNLAARLEGVNKQFGTYIMLSQFTLNQLGETFAVRELGRVAVVGRKEPVTVYEPMRRETYDNNRDLLETFARGLEMFYKGWFTHAWEIFSAIRTLDPAAAAYTEKCLTYMSSPPQEWQGVWVMTTK